MTIKITGLELVRDPSRAFRSKDFEKHALRSLNGSLKLDITQNDITGQAEQALFAINKELQLKLLNIINEIEDDLNGVKNSSAQKDKCEGDLFGGVVNFEDVTVKLPKGEYIVSKDEADRFFESTKVIDSLLNITKPLFGGITKEQLELVEKIVPTFTSNTSDKEVVDTINDLLNKLKNKSGLF